MPTIKQLEKTTNIQYFVVCRTADASKLTYSDSGKAISFANPKHTGFFWCPISILRISEDWQSETMGKIILIPVWFLQKNRIQY